MAGLRYAPWRTTTTAAFPIAGGSHKNSRAERTKLNAPKFYALRCAPASGCMPHHQRCLMNGEPVMSDVVIHPATFSSSAALRFRRFVALLQRSLDQALIADDTRRALDELPDNLL